MIGIINVQEWNTIVDIKTGYPCCADIPKLSELQDIAQRFPYPGDRNDKGAEWVFSVAEEIISINDPEWLCLNFPQPLLADLYNRTTPEARVISVKKIIDGIKEFSLKHGFLPVIVGSGTVVPYKGIVKLKNNFSGAAQGTAWTNRMAGIYNAEPGDFEAILNNPHIKFAIKKEEVLSKSSNPSFINHFPDILFAADEGWSFKVFASNNTPLAKIEKEEEFLPVYSEIGIPSHIEDIHALMNGALDKGKKVLLAIVEGIGADDFECTLVNNRRDWYTYSAYSLYYTLVTGKTFYDFDLPPVYDMSKPEPLEYPVTYPFSMELDELCSHSIGRRKDKRTACVGSRSMTSHSIINADITAECFMRSLVNMGILITVHTDFNSK